MSTSRGELIADQRLTEWARLGSENMVVPESCSEPPDASETNDMTICHAAGSTFWVEIGVARRVKPEFFFSFWLMNASSRGGSLGRWVVCTEQRVDGQAAGLSTQTGSSTEYRQG